MNVSYLRVRWDKSNKASRNRLNFSLSLIFFQEASVLDVQYVFVIFKMFKRRKADLSGQLTVTSTLNATNRRSRNILNLSFAIVVYTSYRFLSELKCFINSLISLMVFNSSSRPYSHFHYYIFVPVLHSSFNYVCLFSFHLILFLRLLYIL